MSQAALQSWEEAERHLAAGQADQANRIYLALLDNPDWTLPANLRLSVLALQARQLRRAVAHALAAHAVHSDEQDEILIEALCAQLIKVGELAAAVACIESPAIAQCRDPVVLQALGKLMNEQSLPQQAFVLLQRAGRAGAGSPMLHYQLGLACMYSGDLDQAEDSFDTCLRMDADFAPAHRARAKLRRQTESRNHVPVLRAAIGRAGNPVSATLLQYALFKELDDIGDTEAAWSALETGMRLRRQQLRFDEAAEEALFQHLMQWPADTDGPAPAIDTPGDGSIAGPIPIFIVGMPRSGTTLLERILGAHPEVADAGELRDFNTQLRWVCERMGGPHLDLDLAQHARRSDLRAVGRRYLSHTQWYANGRRFFTDKLPANFTHIGHIARALPHARILHMVRGPMDTCFSNLKELFADAYPHSYEQGKMARHYVRYRALMAHWHASFPHRILDVDYARLVQDPAEVSREVLAFCGLSHVPGMEAIEARTGAVATASSVQLREPIHTRFVGQWRRYAPQLQPLRDALGRASE